MPGGKTGLNRKLGSTSRVLRNEENKADSESSNKLAGRVPGLPLRC